MKFKGILLRFDCTDNMQFENIGRFWDLMSSTFPEYQLKGLGLNWADNSFDYVIGDLVGKYDYSHSRIDEAYPDSKVVERELPEDGWKSYTGTVEELPSLYETIYKDGVLDYEIEEFDDRGNCIISILRL